MLELEHVRKYYESPVEPVHAVDDVCMSVGASELVAIFGPSGSGKTTLLLLGGVVARGRRHREVRGSRSRRAVEA